MNLKNREGSRVFKKKMFGIHILHRTRGEKNHLLRKYKTKSEEEDVWRIDNGRNRGSERVQNFAYL